MVIPPEKEPTPAQEEMQLIAVPASTAVSALPSLASLAAVLRRHHVLLPKSISDLPEDMVYEILLHLPVRSLLRLRSISNWGEFLSEPFFIAQHLKHSPPLLLIHAIDGEEGDIQNANNFIYKYSGPTIRFGDSGIERYNPSPQPDGIGLLEIVGSCNGVFCISRGFLALDLVIWNPATRETLFIPRPMDPDTRSLVGAFAGFGVDVLNDKYFVFRITFTANEEDAEKCQFYDFQSGVWVWEGENDIGEVSFRSLMRTTEVVVSGTPYWRAWYKNQIVLVWYDIGKRSFGKGSFSWPQESTFVLCELVEGVLGAVVWDYPESVIFDVFLREGGIWSLKYRVDKNFISVRGRFCGVHWANLIVQELVATNGKSHISTMKLCDDADPGIEDFVSLENAQRVGKVLSYRESLKILPR